VPRDVHSNTSTAIWVPTEGSYPGIDFFITVPPALVQPDSEGVRRGIVFAFQSTMTIYYVSQ
jgi:hypothetical protein